MKKTTILSSMMLLSSLVLLSEACLSRDLFSKTDLPGTGNPSSLTGIIGTMDMQINRNLLDSGKIKIASLSYIPIKWDKEANLKTIEKMSRKAASEGAQILITPEGGLEGYLIEVLLKSSEREKWEPKFREIAEPLDGPSVLKVRALARELGVDIVLGFLERDGDILYNSCAWIDLYGQIIHVHRKTHEAQPYFDPESYHPGYEVKAFDTRFGRAGMMICYERQIPEVASALALDGARLLVIPSFGSRGEWNTVMLRARARDNEAYLIFTHPKQTLVISPDGEIITDVDNGQGAGIIYAELDLVMNPQQKLIKRRPEVFAGRITEYLSGGNQRLSRPGHIRVAAVQMHSYHNLRENVNSICWHLSECAQKGVRVAVFPECAVTGYFKDDIPRYTSEDYLHAEKEIAKACIFNKIYAVVGTPYFEDGQRYNMALVINDKGQTIYHQSKINLVGGDKPWAHPGNRLGIFCIDGEICSIIICHDSRYPELVRLPAIKGARLVFYLSCESNIIKEDKIEPYRAQVVARAVENNVYIVQANTPQRINPLEGSHGQSRIVDPNGNLIQEGSIFNEDVLIEELDLTKASGKTAKRSLEAGFLKDWWNKGLELVNDPDSAASTPDVTVVADLQGKSARVIYGEPLSEDYEVWVNGKKTAVYVARVQDPPWGKIRAGFDHGGNYSFTSFDISGPVKIRIRSINKNLSSTILRPNNVKVQNLVRNDHEITFTIFKPLKLSVEPDGKNAPLLLFANPPYEYTPDKSDNNIIYFGPGTHKPDSSIVRVRENQMLFLAEGAIVKAGIIVSGNNATICGRGILDGNEFVWRESAHNMVAITGNNVVVRDIIIRGAASGTISIRNCHNVVIENVKILGGRAQNDDGIIPINAQDVLIKNCFIRSDDDCIALKGMQKPPANKNVERITCENSILWCDRAMVFRLGAESRAEYMRDIVFRNIDILHYSPRAHPVFDLSPGEGMKLQNVLFKNIRINGEGQIEFIRLMPTINQWMITKVPGYINDITFKNITLTGEISGDYTIQLTGADEKHIVSGVILSGISVLGKKIKTGSKNLRIDNYVYKVTIR